MSPPTRTAFYALSLAAAALGIPTASPAQSTDAPIAQPVYEFSNGRWFDGTGFTEGTFYTQYGTLTAARPAAVDSVIDLDGGWVVPPYGEGHNHNLADGPGLPELIDRYLGAGVFYVKNPNALPSGVFPIRSRVNRAESVDVSFSFGGFTGPGGHPISVVQRQIDFGAWTEAYGDGAFYYEVSDEEELDWKWAGFLAHGPDFVKAYLLYSEEFDARAGDPSYVGLRGMDPRLLAELVRRAHAADLRVSAHVETAQDFRNALGAGVDEIIHLPGFRGNDENRFPDPTVFRLDDADASAAAEQEVVVVTTLGDFDEFEDEATAWAARDLFRHNLRTLRRHGVELAIGSDSWESVGVDEAFQLADLDVFGNLELLRMWVETTPTAIFPNRRIGRLAPGYEASFLVLGGNPIDDLAATGDIRLRVKRGMILEEE